MQQVPEKNDIVTVVSTQLNDRAYSRAVWKVIGVNETHVNLLWVGGDTYWKDHPPIILALKHYQFSLADEFKG